jgi:type II secretory pathway component PulK
MKRWQNHGRRGSILIVVLWVLLLISLLAGRYLSHNRGKAAAAAYGWQSLIREQAFLSVLELYAAGGQPLPPVNRLGESELEDNQEQYEPQGVEEDSDWRSLAVGKLKLLLRESSEKERINLNSAADDAVRNQVRQGLGEDRQEEADQVADALLDWRDPDDLVRSDGAEKDFYQQEGLAYEPADGPFKTLNEMLLVRGVTSELFWGDVPVVAYPDQDNQGDGEDITPAPIFSLINVFTISGKSVKRVEVLFPQDNGAAMLFTALLQGRGQKWKLFRCYRAYLSAAEKEEETEKKW